MTQLHTIPPVVLLLCMLQSNLFDQAVLKLHLFPLRQHALNTQCLIQSTNPEKVKNQKKQVSKPVNAAIPIPHVEGVTNKDICLRYRRWHPVFFETNLFKRK